MTDRFEVYHKGAFFRRERRRDLPFEYQGKWGVLDIQLKNARPISVAVTSEEVPTAIDNYANTATRAIYESVGDEGLARKLASERTDSGWKNNDITSEPTITLSYIKATKGLFSKEDIRRIKSQIEAYNGRPSPRRETLEPLEE